MSSAKRNSLAWSERGRSPMSLIKIRNRMGPRIGPCGTPEDTGREEEREFPTLTDWEWEHK